MTKQQSFKRRVRDRMGKTRESYTAARRQLLDKAATPPDPGTDPAASRTPDDQTGWSGVSAAMLQRRTGRDWESWFAVLDAWDAANHKHPEIATWLVTEHNVDGWWAQSITVGYEQARGIRAPGQRSNGTFSATASKTIDVPVERIFEAWADESLRGLWLPGTPLAIRSSTHAKSVRGDWAGGSSRVIVGFTAKGNTKGQVALEHERLPDAETAEEMKAFWRERVAVLKTLLEGGLGSTKTVGGQR